MEKEIVGKDAFGMGQKQAEECALYRVEVNLQAGFWQQDLPTVLSWTRGNADCMFDNLGHRTLFLQKYISGDANNSDYKLVIVCICRMFC